MSVVTELIEQLQTAALAEEMGGGDTWAALMWRAAKEIERLNQEVTDAQCFAGQCRAEQVALVDTLRGQEREIERLRAEHDRVTCSACGCSVPRVATKDDGVGGRMCVDLAVASGCRFLAEIERLREIGPRLKAYAYDRYPDLSGPGWLQRAAEQHVVNQFIEGFLAAKAGEEK